MPLLLILTLCVATLTLWIPAYWPVGAFEISVFLIAGIVLLTERLPPPGTWYPVLAMGFIVGWGCLQWITGRSIYRFETERDILQWLSWIAVYYAGISLLRDLDSVRRMRTVIVWFGFAVAVEAILQAYVSPGKVFGLYPTGYHDFVMGPIIYHTHYAAFVESILPISLFLAFKDAKRAYVFLGISAVLFTSVVVSASRGGLIITSAEIFLVAVLTRRRKLPAGKPTGVLILAMAGATGALMLIVGFGTVWERFRAETLTQGRAQYAMSTLHMIALHPWIGFGLGCWPTAYPAFATFDPGAIVNQAHSNWLQWTAEGGLPVGLAMLTLFLWALLPAIRSIWGIGAVAVLVHAAFDYPFSRPAVGAWPILILAMAAVTEAQKQQRRHGSGGAHRITRTNYEVSPGSIT